MSKIKLFNYDYFEVLIKSVKFFRLETLIKVFKHNMEPKLQLNFFSIRFK